MSEISQCSLLVPGKSSALLQSLETFPVDQRNCLLIGPPKSQLTLLAFHFAFNAANEGTGDVLYLCQRTTVDGSPAVQLQGVDRVHPAFKHIKIRYLQSDQELQQYAACLHLLPQKPAVVIIDGISSFFAGFEHDKRVRDGQLSKTLALLADGMETLRSTSGKRCPLLVTDEAVSEGPRAIYILQRWLPVILDVQGSQAGGYVMSVHPSTLAALSLPQRLAESHVHYRVLPTHIQVDKVTFVPRGDGA